jgi:hypothetical protein
MTSRRRGCIAGNRTWLYRLPQSKIIMYSYLANCYRVKHLKKISSSAPGLSMMTLRECHVDRPFPDHVIRLCVRTSPGGRPPPPRGGGGGGGGRPPGAAGGAGA